MPCTVDVDLKEYWRNQTHYQFFPLWLRPTTHLPLQPIPRSILQQIILSYIRISLPNSVSRTIAPYTDQNSFLNLIIALEFIHQNNPSTSFTIPAPPTNDPLFPRLSTIQTSLNTLHDKVDGIIASIETYDNNLVHPINSMQRQILALTENHQTTSSYTLTNFLLPSPNSPPAWTISKNHRRTCSSFFVKLQTTPPISILSSICQNSPPHPLMPLKPPPINSSLRCHLPHNFLMMVYSLLPPLRKYQWHPQHSPVLLTWPHWAVPQKDKTRRQPTTKPIIHQLLISNHAWCCHLHTITNEG